MNTEPSLLELGLAISGTPVDLDRVQISDETAVAQIAESAMAVAGKEMASFSLDGYSQDDGSLLVVTVVGGAEIFRYVVKSGEWREVTDDEAVKQRLQEARAFGDDDGIGPEVEAHKAHHQAFVAAAEAQLASSDGVMLVVCKGESGMNTLRLFLKLVGAEERVADDWLAGPDHYFVVYSRRKGGEENWSATWPGADGLSKFLIVASRRCVAIEDTVLVAEGGSFEETAALTRLWATLGGAVLGSAASSKKLEPIASPAAPEATDELSAPTGDPVPSPTAHRDG